MARYVDGNNKNTTKAGGVGFFGLLLIAFIVLKLCGVINWSWVWVLAPLWLPTPLALVIILICVAVSVIRSTIRNRKRK